MINHEEQKTIDSSWDVGNNRENPAISPFAPLSQSQIRPNSTRRSLIKEIFQTILLFAAVFIFVYLFLTFPAQYAKLKYFAKNIFSDKNPQTIELPQLTWDQDLFLSSIQSALEKAPDRVKKYSIDISDLQNNSLIIPKIEVKAPIIWQVVPDEKLMLKELQKGVVHYNGTGLPDEPRGNVFISGHSSYYWWDKGSYKTIFANLDKMEIGDEIALAYQEKVYIYKVFEKIVVKPNQVEVLNATDKPILSLMTCIPVGTNLKRLIIKAQRLEITASSTSAPSPANNQSSDANQPSPLPSNLPASTKVPESQPLEILPWL